MKILRIKNRIKYFLYTLLCVVFLTSCKHTYYKYDIDKMCEECKNNEGVNRFTNDMNTIVVWCNDGTVKRLK